MCNYVLHLPALLSSTPLITVSAVITPHPLLYSSFFSLNCFYNLSLFSALLLAHTYVHSPHPLPLTHPLNRSFIHHSFSHPAFISPILLYPSPFTILCSFLPFASIDLCLRSVSPVFQQLSLPLYLSIFPFTSLRFIFLLSLVFITLSVIHTCFPLSFAFSPPLCFRLTVCSQFSVKQ